MATPSFRSLAQPLTTMTRQMSAISLQGIEQQSTRCHMSHVGKKTTGPQDYGTTGQRDNGAEIRAKSEVVRAKREALGVRSQTSHVSNKTTDNKTTDVKPLNR